MEEKSLTGLELFDPLKSQLAVMKQEAMDIKVENILDKFNAKRAHDKRMEIVKVRTSAETIKKEGKKRILEEGKKWDTVYNTIEGECKESENYLREQEEIVTKEEERQEKERQEKEAKKVQDRIDSLLKFPMVYTGTGYSYLTLAIDSLTMKVMDDEQFTQFLAKVETEYNAEKNRIEEEQRKAKEESERLEAEKQRLQKITDEQAAEAKRLQEEKDEIAKEKEEALKAKNKARQERLFAIGLTWNGVSYSYKKAVVTKESVADADDVAFEELVDITSENIKAIKSQDELDRLAEEKRLADQAAEKERQRIAKEKADFEQAELEKRAEIERKKALAPDKEKLIYYADRLWEVKLITDLNSEVAQKILDTANDTIQDTISFIRTEANKL